MAKFTRSILRILNRLYRFGSGGPQGTDTLDLTSPIQLVHDVSREAELGSGKDLEGGYFFIPYSVTHAGAGSVNEEITPATALGNVAETAGEDLDVWILEVLTHDNLNVISLLTVDLIFPSTFPGLTPGAGYTPVLPIYIQSGTTEVCAPGAGGYLYAGVGTAAVRSALPVRYPSVGATIGIRSTVTGATAFDLFLLCWVAPKGTTPPGVR